MGPRYSAKELGAKLEHCSYKNLMYRLSLNATASVNASIVILDKQWNLITVRHIKVVCN